MWNNLILRDREFKDIVVDLRSCDPYVYCVGVNFTDRNGTLRNFNFGARFINNIDDDTIDLVSMVAQVSCKSDSLFTVETDWKSCGGHWEGGGW